MRLAQAVLLDLTILFAAFAQLTLNRGGEEPTGAALYASAVLTLLASLLLQHRDAHRALQHASAVRNTSSHWRVAWWHSLLAGAVVLAQGAVALLVYRNSPQVLLAAILWLLSIALAVGIAVRVSWPVASMPALLSRMRGHLAVPRLELAAVAAIVAVGAALRLTNLEAYPSGIHGDEGEMGVIAASILQGKGPDLFGTAFLGDPAAFMYLEAPFISLFGQTITAIRMLAGLTGTATLVACYALSRSLFGPRVAIFATALLAGAALAIFFSRLAVDVPEVPLLAVLCFYFVWRGYSMDAPVWWLLSGLMAGGGLYFHFSSPLIALTIALFMFYLLATGRLLPRQWFRSVAVLCAGFVVAALPFLVHMAGHSDSYLPHIEGKTLFQHWAEAAATYKTSDPLLILWRQLTTTVSAFTHLPDRLFYAFTGRPMLNGVTAALFVLGLALIVARLRDPRYALLFFWFWSVVIVGGALTLEPPQFHRLLPALLPALIGAGVALDWIVTGWARLLGRPLAGLLVGGAVLVPIVSAAYDANAFFGVDAQAYPFAEGTFQARYMAALGPTADLFVAGRPFEYASYGVAKYLAPDVEKRDLANLPMQLPRPPLSRPLAILVDSRLDAWMPVLEAFYPNGAATPVTVGNGQKVLTVFQVPPGGSSAGWPSGQGLAGQVTASSSGTQAWQGMSPVLAFREISALLPDAKPPYAGQWRGNLNVPSAGSYTLELWTDAAATLDVDGQALVQAPEASVRTLRQTLDLTAGAHQVQIDAHWSRGEGIIEFYWQVPGAATEALVPADDLAPPT